MNIHADAAAQDVVVATKDMNLGRDDLEMIMALPTDSVTQVLIAYRQAGGTSAGPECLHKLVIMRWNALLQGICYQSRPESFLTGFRLLLPTTWRECRDEYSRQYDELRQRMHPDWTDLAKVWRSGKYAHTPGTPHDFEIYPDVAPPPKSSTRQMAHLDKVRQGEFYPAPADDKMAAFAKCSRAF